MPKYRQLLAMICYGDSWRAQLADLRREAHPFPNGILDSYLLLLAYKTVYVAPNAAMPLLPYAPCNTR